MPTRFITILSLTLAAAICLTPARDAAAQARRDPAYAQVEAATSDAMQALKHDIRSASITPTLTVQQFLDETDAVDALDETIERAQQIGGPRWIDDQTCQVKLEIAGARIARALVSIAAVRPRVSPLPAAAMEQRLGDWKQRSFTATGTSIAAEKVQGIRPDIANQQWTSISDDDRRQAVLAARQDAARKLIDSIRPIEFEPGRTIGDVLQREPVRQAVSEWVASQPVVQLKYEDNLEVELTVAAPPDELVKTVIESAGKSQGTTLPADPQSVAALQREFARHTMAAIGRARVVHSVTQAAPPEKLPVVLPDRAPAWASDPLDAEAAAPPAKSKLRTQSDAVARATEILRSRVNALSLTPDLTIEQAAASDPRIAGAVERVMLRARLYKVDYNADGTATVRMMLDSRDLWSELRQATSR